MPPGKEPTPMGRPTASLGIAAGLLAAVAAVYARSAGFDFINYDDPKYILENPAVRDGLTPEGVRWAFTATWAANWHPLTWLSHMLDVSLFGLDAGKHHLASVGFHMLNTLLLFHLLRRMTGTLWRSAFVAALFGLHPLHAESVLWIAERKDLLCGLFFFLSLWAYLRHAERPGAARYLPVLLFAALALLSKPMAVTLPFVMLLLDFWPLGRLPGAPAPPDRPPLPRLPPARLLLEKAPLIAMSAASCVVTWHAQAAGGAVRAIPAGIRFQNAAVSYAAYIGKMLWPSGLAVFYPHPMESIAAWKVAGAALLLAAATIAALRAVRSAPWLAVGWGWYAGMLVPVIGLVQAGNQAMADRYTYLPLVGLFIAAAWGLYAAAERLAIPPRATAAAAAALLAALALASWRQAGYWRDSSALFTHALEVTGDNWVGRSVLGEKALEAGRWAEAADHFRAVLRVEPFSVEARNNLGAALMKQGKVDEAVSFLEETVRMNPRVAGVRFNLGLALKQQGRLDEAAAQFREVLRISPGDRAAQRQLARIATMRGG
jgi:tetratricopeptide (TPR) repeat protein